MTTPHRLRPPRTVVRARDGRDLLSALPYVLGYHPRESVVVVGLRDARVGPTARIDLADVMDHPGEAGHRLGGFLVGAGVSRCVLVAYGAAGLGWLPEFSDALVTCGVRAEQGWQVGEQWYWPMGHEELRAPVAELGSSTVSAELVLAGMSPVADRAALLDGVQPYPPQVCSRVRRQRTAVEPLSDDHVEQALDLWAGWLGDPACSAPARSRAGRPPRPMTDADTALLIAAIAQRHVRDAMSVAVIAPIAPRRAAHIALHHPFDQVLDVWFSPGSAVAPDDDRLDAAVQGLRHLARADPRSDATASVFAVLAQLHWWSGDGALANLCIERALTLQPEHRLAGLVDALLSRGTPPPWLCPTAASA